MTGEMDRYGRTALHYSAAENDVKNVEDLLGEGYDPNLHELRQGYTPLHLAAQQWSVEAAEALLNGGAEVDAVDVYGNTPLWTAVFNCKGKNGELIELLRRWGADPVHVNKSGSTPLEAARGIANYDIAQFFSDLP